MAYQSDFNSFAFDHNMHQNILVHSRLPYSGFGGQPVQPDVVYAPYPYHDVYDQPHPGMYPDAYMDEANEPTTRPRLTPEQQSILETQFLSNPKPSSATKKNLAQITKLSPARVANWFQNRRAKAKQQRKQEEFENSQQQQQSGQTAQDSAQDLIEDEEDEEDDKQEDDEEQNKPSLVGSTTDAWRPSTEAEPPKPSASSPADMRELGYASLNRALAAAEAAAKRNAATRSQLTASNDKFGMAPLEMPQQIAFPMSTAPNVPQLYQKNVTQPNWCSQQEMQQMWATSPVNASDMNFDFGFDSAISQNITDSTELTSPSNTTCSQSYSGVSPETWESSLITPTMPTHPQNDYRQPLQSPCFPIPSYGSSRRPSIADSLTNNLEHIALTGSTASGSVSSRTSDAGIGLAERRKRPGLAPLKGEALRSRSYGALTAASPTFRQGMTPPAAQALRHTKSTGYSLNSQFQYGGVRKSSLPRKSPLAASFAEADFQKFMAQKIVDIDGHQQQTPVNITRMNHPPLPEHAIQQFHAHQMPQMPKVPEVAQRSQVSSPPITPFQTEFFNGMHSTSMMPSSSIQAQYATAADWTPPYSAGPLTNSSFSDAPLTSPDFAHYSPFPPVQYIPSLSPIAHHHHHHQQLPQNDDNNNFTSWVFPSDHSPQSVSMNQASISNKSADDFKINLYEFPNQREEHAQATKQLPRAPHQHHNVFVHESANYFNKDKSPK